MIFKHYLSQITPVSLDKSYRQRDKQPWSTMAFEMLKLCQEPLDVSIKLKNFDIQHLNEAVALCQPPELKRNDGRGESGSDGSLAKRAATDEEPHRDISPSTPITAEAIERYLNRDKGSVYARIALETGDFDAKLAAEIAHYQQKHQLPMSLLSAAHKNSCYDGICGWGHGTIFHPRLYTPIIEKRPALSIVLSPKHENLDEASFFIQGVGGKPIYNPNDYQAKLDFDEIGSAAEAIRHILDLLVTKLSTVVKKTTVEENIQFFSQLTTQVAEHLQALKQNAVTHPLGKWYLWLVGFMLSNKNNFEEYDTFLRTEKVKTVAKKKQALNTPLKAEENQFINIPFYHGRSYYQKQRRMPNETFNKVDISRAARPNLHYPMLEIERQLFERYGNWLGIFINIEPFELITLPPSAPKPLPTFDLGADLTYIHGRIFKLCLAFAQHLARDGFNEVKEIPIFLYSLDRVSDVTTKEECEGKFKVFLFPLKVSGSIGRADWEQFELDVFDYLNQTERMKWFKPSPWLLKRQRFYTDIFLPCVHLAILLKIIDLTNDIDFKRYRSKRECL